MCFSMVTDFISFDKNNKYTLLNNEGQTIFCAVEKSDRFHRYIHGELRAFEIQILNSQAHEIIRISRPFTNESFLLSQRLNVGNIVESIHKPSIISDGLNFYSREGGNLGT